MVTRRPLLVSNAPRELAVRPLPSDDTTPPVTKTNFVGWEFGRRGPRSRGSASRPTDAHVNTEGAVGRVGTGQVPGYAVVLRERPVRRWWSTGDQVHQQRHQKGRGGRRHGHAAVVDQRAEGE